MADKTQGCNPPPPITSQSKAENSPRVNIQNILTLNDPPSNFALTKMY